MQKKQVTIPNELGLHARAAATFAKEAAGFDAEIQVCKNGMQANGKSIMELLTLAAPQGTEITIHAEGEDEDGALDSLSRLVHEGFGEL